MPKRLLLPVLSLVLALSLGLAGCGSGNTSGSPGNGPVGTTIPINPSSSNPQPTASTYLLTTQITPANSGTISPGSGPFAIGSSITLRAMPATYYIFDGWSGNASGSDNPLTLKIDSNKTVGASFKKIQYPLQLTVDSPGSGTVIPSSGNYEAGNPVNITANPAAGYRFDHWGGNASGASNQTSVVMDSSKTVTAYFTKVYSLSVSASPVGIGAVTPGNGSYDAGTQVKLAAVTTTFPNAFDRWIGTDNDTANPTVVTMNSDKGIIANFKQLKAGIPVATKASIGLPGGGTIATLALSSGQWVQGHVTGDLSIGVRIVDPSNNEVVGLGWTQDSQFTFQAKTQGNYGIVIYGVNMALYDNRYAYNYNLTYTIYQ